jgi:hypothetical protein
MELTDKQKSILKKFELLIASNKPAIIKKIKAFINYEENSSENSVKCFMSTVEMYVETEEYYTIIPWLGDADGYETEEEKEKIKIEMTNRLIKILEKDLYADYTKDFWEHEDLKQEIWKRKEE